MEKEKLNYQAPTITRRKVVMQEMIAASYTPEDAIKHLSVNNGYSVMMFQEGSDYAFEANLNADDFKTGWEEE